MATSCICIDVHLSDISLVDTCFLIITRNCSKLRKIHSGQGPISLTINPSEFKFFRQFVLLWFKFSRCQLMSLQFLHMTSMTRDPYIYAVKACAKFVLMTRKWNTTKWNFNHAGNVHYSDVIMSAMASQITGVLIVCLNVCSITDQRKHQSSMSLAFVRGIHRWLVNSPHKGPVTRGRCSHLMTSSWNENHLMKWAPGH